MLMTTTPDPSAMGCSCLFAIIGIMVYFLPAFVALQRHHPNAVAIFLLDLLLGWTLLGWIGALVWSATAVQRRP